RRDRHREAGAGEPDQGRDGASGPDRSLIAVWPPMTGYLMLSLVARSAAIVFRDLFQREHVFTVLLAAQLAKTRTSMRAPIVRIGVPKRGHAASRRDNGE